MGGNRDMLENGVGIVQAIFTGVLAVLTWYLVTATRELARATSRQLSVQYSSHVKLEWAATKRSERTVSVTVTIRDEKRIPLHVDSIYMGTHRIMVDPPGYIVLARISPWKYRADRSSNSEPIVISSEIDLVQSAPVNADALITQVRIVCRDVATDAEICIDGLGVTGFNERREVSVRRVHLARLDLQPPAESGGDDGYPEERGAYVGPVPPKSPNPGDTWYNSRSAV